MGFMVGILTNLEAEYDLDIVEEFFSHYSMMCEMMETLIIGLEKEEHYATNIQELFRIYHNIKSATGFLNIVPMVKLATLVEEVLEEARELNGPANETFVDWMLQISDQFNQYKNDIEMDTDQLSDFNPSILKIPTKLDV